MKPKEKMKMRIELTKKMAQQIYDARMDADISQYELANELGWVRSKIKRLEKGEVQSIEESDWDRLIEALDVKEYSPRRGVTRSRRDNVIPLHTGVLPEVGEATTSQKKLFTRVKRISRGGVYRNQVFFRVTMKKELPVEDLLCQVLEIDGLLGAIHGVENREDQDPLKAGDSVVIMLWGPGIALRQGARSKAGA